MAGPDAQALVCIGDRIIAVGNLSDLQSCYPTACHIPMPGVIAPGFNDAHQHLTLSASQCLEVDLSDPELSSMEKVLAALRQRAATTKAGGWVLAVRYDHTRLDPASQLTRANLDQVARDMPVLAVHVSAHWGVANTAALERAGIGAASPDPPGGSLGRDADGQLNGIVYEQALFDFAYPALSKTETIVPLRSEDQRLEGLKEMQRRFITAGITSVGDAMVGPRELELLQIARRRDALILRVNALITYPHFSNMRDAGLKPGFGDQQLRYGGVKVFVDGAVAGGTCAVLDPFEGSDDRGTLTVNPTELARIVADVHRSGNNLAVHANGDRAIEMLLDVIEAEYAKSPPLPEQRHRIEHCSLVTPNLVSRIANARLTVVPFGSYVRFHGRKLLQWYGPERLRRMFAHRWMLDAGVVVAGSSDYPCGPFEPLLAIQSCVSRQSTEGTVLGPEQRISVEEALALYTVGSAYASGEEAVKGRIAPGYLADLVVLDRDPRACPPSEIGAISVLETWSGGRRIWPDPELVTAAPQE